MLIDGFTVVAQIINFLILILLLRRFLYGPIMRAMNEREARIANRMEEAEQLKQEALQESETYRQQRKALDDHRDALLSEAREEVEIWRKANITKVREEIDETRTRWYTNFITEKHAFLRDLRQKIAEQVCAISRRVLADLADAELEQQVIAIFLRRIEMLDDTKLMMLRQAVGRSGNGIILRSAFDISPELRLSVLQRIQDSIASDIELRFEIMPDLLCGIEISTQDYKLSWALDDYMASLEESLFATFDEDVELVQHV